MALCQLLSTACASHSYVCILACDAASDITGLTASTLHRVCTPYMPPAQPSDTWTPPDRLVHTRLPNFGYQLFFASDEGRTLMQRNVGSSRIRSAQPPISGSADHLLCSGQIENVLVPMFSQFGPPKSTSGKTERDGRWVLPGEYAKRLERIDKARQAGQRLVPPIAEQDPVRTTSSCCLCAC